MSGKDCGESRTGAEILVAQLRIQGVERIFCVPGESYLAVLDALVDAPEIKVTVCRHEGGAAMMADAYGKLTGKPGIVFVTRGPGATNASSGVHVAMQDSTPLIMFIGHVERNVVDREAFQEIDYRHLFGSITKWVTNIDESARVPELVSRAFYTATSGRPGPVVISLPEDMLIESASVPDAKCHVPARPGVAGDEAHILADRLKSAQRPIIVVGGGDWTQQACEDLARFAETWNIPVATSFRRNDLIDNLHPNYAGNLGLGANPILTQAIKNSDLLILAGGRLGELPSANYTLLKIPVPDQPLVHIHPDPEEIGRVYQPVLGINAGMPPAMQMLAALPAPAAVRDRSQVEELHSSFLEWTAPTKVIGNVQMCEIMDWLRDRLPADSILTNGAGNFSIWPNRYYHYRGLRTMLAPTSGSMGYGVPAAVAAKVTYPERMVICFAGDGDFMMTGQELATAAGEQAAVIVIVLNNGMYGTIRMHQEMAYPHRISGTQLHNPDFCALARAYGGHAELVRETAEFAPAFERAVAAGTIALIEIVIEPELISPTLTITGIRNRSRPEK